jgi:hypothetical protein
METREIPMNPYSVGILGAADQGKEAGATSKRKRLPVMHLVLTPDPLVCSSTGGGGHLLCAHQPKFFSA